LSGVRQNRHFHPLMMTAIPSHVQMQDWGGIYEMNI
jgi:hypothetical protein